MSVVRIDVMKVIAIANQKGGTAKTTTTAALGVLLSRLGLRVHLVDMDPQASLTQTFGYSDPADRLYVSLKDRAGLPICEVAPNLTLTPGSLTLSRAESELLTEIGREHFLRTALERTALPDNTVTLLDCPPSLGVLAVNCFCAAGGLIVVVQPGGFELHAVVHLDMTIRAIQKQANPDLTVLGTILTNCHKRRAITGRVHEEIARIHNVLGVVRTDARLLYATTAGTLLKLKRSNALADYAQVAERLREIIA
jgi:chromosome partitioning protein